MLQRLGSTIRSAAAAFVTSLQHGLAKDRGKAIAALTFTPCFGVCCRESSDAAKLKRACCLRLETLLRKEIVSAGKLYGRSHSCTNGLGSRRLLQDLQMLLAWELTFPSGETSSAVAMPVHVLAPHVAGIPKKCIVLLMVQLSPWAAGPDLLTGRDGCLARTRFVQPVRPNKVLCNGVAVGGLDFRVSVE